MQAECHYGDFWNWMLQKGLREVSPLGSGIGVSYRTLHSGQTDSHLTCGPDVIDVTGNESGTNERSVSAGG
jgi:hypothetical protein